MFFLQKRAKDAKRLPNYFGFFGGGVELDETPEQALKRETKEELNLDISNYEFFKFYEFERSLKNIFIYNTDKNFENIITVLEGQYGKWFNGSEVLNESLLIEEDKKVLKDLYQYLCK